jgi:hypothetical protein
MKEYVKQQETRKIDEREGGKDGKRRDVKSKENIPRRTITETKI